MRSIGRPSRISIDARVSGGSHRPPCHAVAATGAGRLHEEFVEALDDARADRSRRVLLLFQQLARHDDIGIDRPEGHADVLGDALPPRFHLPLRVFVAHEQRRPDFVEKRQQPMMRVRAQDESHPTLPQPGRDVLEAFGEELVVPQVGAADERIQTRRRRPPAAAARCPPRSPRRARDCPRRAARAASSRRPPRRQGRSRRGRGP